MAERYTAEERRPIGCAHEHTARGPDIPLRYGSWRSEVCQTCGLWRPMGHSPHAPVGDGLWSEGSLEEAAKPLEEF